MGVAVGAQRDRERGMNNQYSQSNISSHARCQQACRHRGGGLTGRYSRSCLSASLAHESSPKKTALAHARRRHTPLDTSTLHHHSGLSRQVDGDILGGASAWESIGSVAAAGASPPGSKCGSHMRRRTRGRARTVRGAKIKR